MWELDCEESWMPKSDAFELWCWRRLLRVWNCNTLATSCEELTHWKRLWCWEGLGAGGEGDSKGWDGWMASPTWWTWAWVNSGSWWWTGRPNVLQSMGSQRVGCNWTELSTYPLEWLKFSVLMISSQLELPCTAAGCKNGCNYFGKSSDSIPQN